MKQCSIGGQAVMEGVMMRSELGTAIVVRRPDGSLAKEYKKTRKRYKKGSFPTWPFIRGIYSFVNSILNGMDIITRSAEMLGVEEEEEEPSKFETWLSEKFHLPIMKVVKIVAVILAVLLSVGLFVLLPIGLVQGLEALGRLFRWDWLANMNLSVSTVLQGVFRLMIFLLYIYGISRMKEIGRVFMYHGAEHKTIACYESELELTPENAKTCSRLHPRCGTNYLFLVMAVSILLTTVFTALMNLIPGFAEWQTVGINRFLFRLARIVLIPLIAGVSYEVLKAAASSESIFAKIVRAPGLALQHLTTKEPDLDMLEVAIASFQLVLNPPDHDILFADQPSAQESAQTEA
ncbi:MAG: DUF1385 domain-containing protein [Clostridia bacterium]|nr:DUF1385 domain-containing protein [Clostridia bacterium]